MDRKDLKPTLLNGDRDDMAPGLSRRSFFMAAGAAGVGAGANLLGSKPAAAQSQAWLQPGNNNHVIDLQGGDGSGQHGCGRHRLFRPLRDQDHVAKWRHRPV